MKKLAPVVIFCYQRLDSVKLLISSLQSNPESKETLLYIFSDGHNKNNKRSEKKNVLRVRNYISTLKGFKKIVIIKRKKNLGLADNIITGANYIFKKFDSAIFLEDDLVVGNNFLRFMNSSLNFYFFKKKVWHISGWNYNIKVKNEKYDAFLWRAMNCWGWATWKDRWRFFNKNPNLIFSTWSKSKIKEFNLDNFYDFFSQISRNYKGQINTWAIFWYATIFNQKGLCLNPKISLVKNCGLDRFSTHSSFKDDNSLNLKFTNKKKFILPTLLKENVNIVNIIKEFLKKNSIEMYKKSKKNLLIRKIEYFIKIFNKNFI
jgi:hypothetical protein